MTKVLVYCPYSLSGRGPAETCMNIVANFSSDLEAEVFVARVRPGYSTPVIVRPACTSFWRLLPWRFVESRALARLEKDFADALDRADPSDTIAYFYPHGSFELIEQARRRGILTVREMINTALATAAEILTEACARLGLPDNRFAESDIRAEEHELQMYDFIFAPSPLVEDSLRRLGITDEVIIPATFGWDPRRFANSADVEKGPPVRFVFVGSLGVRKGVPDLLEAWKLANVDGELVLAGAPETAEIDRIVQAHVKSGRVRALGHVQGLGPLLHSADVFVFPTLEEGGPQVTYEAAGCGLPIITTPMGTARLVSDGVNGIIVEPGAVNELAQAIRLLASRPDLRSRYGDAARRDAAGYTYGKVGATRSALINDILRRYRHKTAPPEGPVAAPDGER